MAYFYSLRGWLEVAPEQFETAVKVLKSLRENQTNGTKFNLYAGGWCWNDAPINWTRYLFYGADVTADGLEWFRLTLEQLTDLHLELTGYFHAQGEDGENSFIYQVQEDVLNIVEERVGLSNWPGIFTGLEMLAEGAEPDNNQFYPLPAFSPAIRPAKAASPAKLPVG
jgi:hypothetical protein